MCLHLGRFEADILPIFCIPSASWPAHCVQPPPCHHSSKAREASASQITTPHVACCSPPPIALSLSVCAISGALGDSLACRPWVDVTSSSDGNVLTAAYKDGPLFYSEDGGQFWSFDSDRWRAWAALASAGDGSVKFGAESDGYVYIRSEGNIQSMRQLGQRRWVSLAASDTGKCRLPTLSSRAHPAFARSWLDEPKAAECSHMARAMCIAHVGHVALKETS